MKLRLLLLGVTTVLALAGAGIAAATVSFDNGTYFIGRGDVIAYAGKDALIEAPMLGSHVVLNDTMTCVLADGTRVAGELQGSSWRMYFAKPRYAPGNGTITGYTARLQDVDVFNSFDSVSISCGGQPAVYSTTFADWNVVSITATLTFEGHVIPTPENIG